MDFFKPEDFPGFGSAEALARRCNEILAERGQRVYGYAAPDSAYAFRAEQESDDTHTALLVAVEPLRKETACDVLRDVLALTEAGGATSVRERDAMVERIRAVLEREGGR